MQNTNSTLAHDVQKISDDSFLASTSRNVEDAQNRNYGVLL